MKTTVRIAAAQIEVRACFSEEEFAKIINSMTAKAVDQGADVVVFPEDVGFCLAWAKECKRVSDMRLGRCVTSMGDIVEPGWRGWIDRGLRWILNKIHMNMFGEWLAQARICRIIERVFSEVAAKYKVVVISGTTYARRHDGIYGVCFVYDSDGSCVGEYHKRKLVPIELAWGIKAGPHAVPIQTKDYSIGVCICYDLNDADLIRDLSQSAQFIVAPSGGWRPYPGYPFDPVIDQPQIARAKENGISIARVYCSGWMAPGMFFEGHSCIVGPDGNILIQSGRYDKGKVFCADIPLKTINK